MILTSSLIFDFVKKDELEYFMKLLKTYELLQIKGISFFIAIYNSHWIGACLISLLTKFDSILLL